VTASGGSAPATIAGVSLYGQEPEVTLLGAFLARLEHCTVIDVGAEQGAFAEAMLRAGADEVHSLEPEPRNAAFLRKRFDGEARVLVHELAAADENRRLELHLSSDASGAPLPFGHTVLERPDTDEIAWRQTVTVDGRSLASLVADGVLPRRVGILKVDTEGCDAAVIAGLGDLECDVIMLEHWTDLPHSLGQCPWSLDEVVSALRPRHFSHFAFIEHRAEFVFLKWDDGDVGRGHMGNLVFLHDRVLGELLPDVVSCASQLATAAVAVGEMYHTAAEERLELIAQLERECELRLHALEELAAAAKAAGSPNTPSR